MLYEVMRSAISRRSSQGLMSAAHDLRRSLGAWAAGGNVSLHLVSRMLGHKAEGITSVYPRLSVDAVRGAIDKATTAMFAAGEKPAQTKLLEAGRE